MRLDKRKCRKSADPGLKMAAGCGLLHAGQIDYIVRTAVKIIAHQKTLILYVYSRHQAVQGDFRPLWTVFQSKDDFITLARREDGSSAWRMSAFERLDSVWGFPGKCAFYSASDESRLCRYFKYPSGSGFRPLLKTQSDIREHRSRERQRIRENAIVERMSGVPALPRRLKSWIHKSVMPAYFFYDYKRGGKDVHGVCSACGHGIRLSGVKQGHRGTCPHCKQELIMKPRSRRGCRMTDRDTCQVIQNVGSGELVVRIIKAWYVYTGDTPEIRIYENSRQFIRRDSDGKILMECYHHCPDDGMLTFWKSGERPRYAYWQYNFEADVCGHLYGGNLPAALDGTPWQYCPIGDFYDHYRSQIHAAPFLSAYLVHPRLEHLVKTGFYGMVSDMVYRHGPVCLDEYQNRTHRILRVAAEDVGFLRELDTDLGMLDTFQGYTGMKDRKRLFLWQIEHGVNRDILPILQYMTAHKFIRYMDGQYGCLHLRRTPYGGLRYKDMQGLVTEYRDYLDMCHKLDYDMKDSFILYPKDLQKSHDKMARRIKDKKDARVKREFTALYRQLSGQLDFEKDGLKIAYPGTPDDVIKEGQVLHHCVGGYVERVAGRECIILFLRRTSDESKPFYTIEVRGWRVVQVRGMKNCAMTPEVKAFITDWERNVLGCRLPTATA